MGSTGNSRSTDKTIPSSVVKTSKPKRDVQVFACPAAFPISNKPSTKKRSREPQKTAYASSRKWGSKKKNDDLLDWHDTAKEIRAYGATAFVGKQKRNYEAEQYLQLTGRQKKGQRVPLPILRGIKKAAAERDARARQAAREAGIVLPKAKKETKAADATYRSFGPAPNIGFMKGGVYKVQKKKNR